MRSQEITQFTRQLATLLQSGVALLQALDIVIKGMPTGRAKNVVRAIRRRVESGSALNIALKRQAVFGSVYCDVVAAGEAAGMLETMLERLAEHREKTEKLQRSVRTAMAYPIAVLVIALSVMLLLFTFVVPAFENTFAAFHAELPALTRGVIVLSHACVQYGAWVIAVFVPCVWLCQRLLRKNHPMAKALAHLCFAPARHRTFGTPSLHSALESHHVYFICHRHALERGDGCGQRRHRQQLVCQRQRTHAQPLDARPLHGKSHGQR